MEANKIIALAIQTAYFSDTFVILSQPERVHGAKGGTVSPHEVEGVLCQDWLGAKGHFLNRFAYDSVFQLH